MCSVALTEYPILWVITWNKQTTEWFYSLEAIWSFIRTHLIVRNISLWNFHIQDHWQSLLCMCVCICLDISQVNGEVLPCNTCQEISCMTASIFHPREIHELLPIWERPYSVLKLLHDCLESLEKLLKSQIPR